MYDEQVWANKAKDLQSQGRTDLGVWTPPMNWPPCIAIHVGVSGAVASLISQMTKLGVSLGQ